MKVGVDLSSISINKGKVLAETICIMAAYQHYNYYAVMDENSVKLEQVLAKVNITMLCMMIKNTS